MSLFADVGLLSVLEQQVSGGISQVADDCLLYFFKQQASGGLQLVAYVGLLSVLEQ